MLACEECGWKGPRSEAGEKRARFEDGVDGTSGSMVIVVCPECERPVGEGFSEIEEIVEELPF